MKEFSAWLALGFGTFLAVAEAVRNSGDVQWWPFWVVDYVAVALLQWGAISVLWQPLERGTAVLTAAWGFTCAMFYMSLFGHISDLMSAGTEVANTNAQSAIDEPWLTIVIGTMFAFTLMGLATSLLADRRAHRCLVDET
jgi:ABC-type microcin C transport system permease subunit YejB